MHAFHAAPSSSWPSHTLKLHVLFVFSKVQLVAPIYARTWAHPLQRGQTGRDHIPLQKETDPHFPSSHQLSLAKGGASQVPPSSRWIDHVQVTTQAVTSQEQWSRDILKTLYLGFSLTFDFYKFSVSTFLIFPGPRGKRVWYRCPIYGWVRHWHLFPVPWLPVSLCWMPSIAPRGFPEAVWDLW